MRVVRSRRLHVVRGLCHRTATRSGERRRSGEATDPDGGEFECEFYHARAPGTSPRSRGPDAALVLPGAASTSAADESCSGSARPGPRFAQPVRHDPGRRLRDLRAQLQLLVDFGPNLEPVRAFADTWERAADGHSWTFHIRDGMKWSDGEPATSADACFSWQLGLDAIKAEKSLGAGYLEPTMQDAGVTAVACPDPSTLVVTTDDPSDRVLQIVRSRSSPSTSGARRRTRRSAKAKFTPPLVGTGPYQASSGRPASSSASSAIRTTGEHRASPTRSTHHLQDRRHHGPGPQGGRARLRPRPQLRPVQPARRPTRTSRPSRAVPTAGRSSPSTVRASNGKTIPDGGPSTKALLDPKFRDALGYAVDHQALVDRVLGGYGDVGTTIVPPVLTQWHVEPTTPRTFDIEMAKQKLTDAGYPLDATGNRLDKEGKPINLRLFMPDSDENYPKAAQFIRSGTAARDQGHDPGVSSAAPDRDHLPPEAGEKYKADYDIELWGWAVASTRTACSRSSAATRSARSSDSQYCEPAYDELYAEQLKATSNDARKAILTRCRTSSTTSRLPHPVLRREPRGLPDRQVRGLAEPAARERDAVLHVRHPRLHEARRTRRPCRRRHHPSRRQRPHRAASQAAVATPAAERDDRRRRAAATPDPRHRSSPGPWPWSSIVAVGLVVVQSPAERGRSRGCGRGRVTGSARFGGPPAFGPTRVA